MSQPIHDKFNDYRAAVHTGENAEDALGSTAHIAETLAPAMLVALLNNDFAIARHYAEQIRDEAASHFASVDNFMRPAVTDRDPGELADEEMERRKDRARDDLDFYGDAA